jgi:preprotein translocase subunit SecG
MSTLLIFLCVLAAVVLGFVVLVQNPKGGGLAVGFQGASQIGGVQQTADFFEKATWYLSAALFILCMLAAAAQPKSSSFDGGGTSVEQPVSGEEAPAENP